MYWIKKQLECFSGGVNYFPFYPTNKNISAIDELLSAFDEKTYSISLKLINRILEQVGSEGNDWNSKIFIGFVNTFIANNPLAQATLIVGRKRDIGSGMGTLLFPNDHALGDSIIDKIALTLYKGY